MTDSLYDTPQQDDSTQAPSKETEDIVAPVTQENIDTITFDVSLAYGLPLSRSEYSQIESRMISFVQTDKQLSIHHIFLNLSEILAEAVRLKGLNEDLSALAQFEPSIKHWFSEPPTTFEILVFNLLAFKNYQWSEIRGDYQTESSPHKKNLLRYLFSAVMAAFRAIWQGQLEIAKFGKLDLNKTRSYHTNHFSVEIDRFFRQILDLKLSGKTCCSPSLSGLSMIAAYNILVANFLSCLAFAKAQALTRDDKEIQIDDLNQAYSLAERESATMAQLSKAHTQFFDTGFSSPRLFSRLVAESSLAID